MLPDDELDELELEELELDVELELDELDELLEDEELELGSVGSLLPQAVKPSASNITPPMRNGRFFISIVMVNCPIGCCIFLY